MLQNFDLIEEYFTDQHQDFGEKQFRKNAVTILSATDTEFCAEVRETAAVRHKVNLRLDEGSLDESECDCRKGQSRRQCWHVWAAILMLNQRIDSQLKQTTESVKWENLLKTASIPETPFTPVDEALQTNLFTFTIDIDRILSDDQISITVLSAKRLKNGGFGVKKPFELRPWAVHRLADEQTTEVLKDLIALNSASQQFDYSATVVLRSLVQEPVLRQLVDTGRLFWRMGSSLSADKDLNHLTFDNGPLWEVVVSFKERRKTKEWVVSAELQRTHPDSDAKEVRSISDLLFVRKNGIAVARDQLIRIQTSHGFPWLQPLMSAGEIKVPFDDRAKFGRMIQSLPQLAEVDLPKRLMSIQEAPPTCQPRLRFISADRVPPRMRKMKSVFGVLDFVYESGVYPRSDSRSIVAANDSQSKWFRRNGEQEKALWNRLRECGVEPVLQSFDLVDIELKVAESDFFSLVEKLSKEGWEIEAENAPLRQASDFHINVKSGIDWFDMETEVKFDEISVSLPELLEALKHGNDFVQLHDGSRGLLPQTWLDRYSKMAELGTTEGDTIRFRSSQAMLLDAMLSEQDNVRSDKAFSSYCQKLASFHGIKPAEAPRTFQGDLRDYQKEGLGWLKFLQEFRLGGCLADDMGLGKTIQVLALLDQRRSRRLKKDEQRKPSLVIVPKSLVFNWIEEAARFTPKLKVMNFTGVERAEIWAQEFENCHVVVTTYHTMRNEILRLKDINFDYAILDEAQAIKTKETQIAKASRLLHADHRLAMSGTPIENHLGELWSLFEFLNPGMLGTSRTFKRLSGGLKSDPDREQSLQMLNAGLRPFMLRRTKQQVLKELPDKSEQTLMCEMPPKQRKLYDELKAHYRTHLSKKVAELGIKKSKIVVLEALLRLRQVACHPGLVDESKAKLPSAKLEAVVEQLEQLAAEGHKALVFSQFTSFLDLLKPRLQKANLVYEYLDGKTRNRQDRVQRFQTDESCPVFLISLKAGGHGLNLTAADYVFILDPWWNPAVEAQAVDRAHRMGQKRHVNAYRLICKDTVEERILELQKDKRQLAEAVISDKQGVLSQLTAEDLQMLLR